MDKSTIKQIAEESGGYHEEYLVKDGSGYADHITEQ
jgi:hypothetical protein